MLGGGGLDPPVRSGRARGGGYGHVRARPPPPSKPRAPSLAELRKQADELERSAAAAGPAPSGAAAGPAPSGASTAVVAGTTGVSPGKAIANGDMPYRDLARGATHIYERGAFDGETVNISGSSDQLSAMVGGGSAFMRQSSRPEPRVRHPVTDVDRLDLELELGLDGSLRWSYARRAHCGCCCEHAPAAAPRSAAAAAAPVAAADALAAAATTTTATTRPVWVLLMKVGLSLGMRLYQ